MKVWMKRSLLALAVLLVAAQVVRPARTNPTVDPKLEISAIHTGSPAAMGILERSCNDCHSNRTVWPWYSKFAPASWLVTSDVNEGRSEMNLSEWGAYSQEKRQKLLGKMCEEVTEGDMPGALYATLHPQARLTGADVQAVCAFSKAGLEGELKDKGRRGHEDEDDD